MSESERQAAPPEGALGAVVQRLRGTMIPVFLGLALTLLALALLIGQTVLAQQEARAQAIAEGDALLASHQLLAAVLDGETGQRGYLLTRKPEYLKPYSDAKRRLDLALVAMRAAEARSAAPAETRRMDEIALLARTKFIELDRAVSLSSAGFDEQALTIVQSDIGKHQMDAIRAQITAFREDKTRQRAASFERAAQLERRLLPLVSVLGVAIVLLVIAGFRAERSRAGSAAEAAQAHALREANERAVLLTRELNHRVKNLFSVILSIVALSARKQTSTPELIEDIRSRIRALALAHDTSQGGTSDERTDLGAVIARTMEPYSDGEGKRVRQSGCAVALPMRMVTPMGLIIHEMATNAAKYGGLSNELGRVEIAWDIIATEEGQQVVLRWTEFGGPPLPHGGERPSHAGFGTKMTEMAAQQMGGSLERQWPAEGAVAVLRFPLS